MSLDPQVNAEIRHAQRAEENEPKPLNPPFPYNKLRFDPALFEVLAEVDTGSEGT